MQEITSGNQTTQVPSEAQKEKEPCASGEGQVPFGDLEWLQGALEALLFVSDEPASAEALAAMLEVSTPQVHQALSALQLSLAQNERGIQLAEVAGGWRLGTHPRYHRLIERYVLSWDTRKLSQAALETLAVVAYVAPATRATIASIRGVNSDSPINSLLEKGLLREAGTQDAPGNPTLYATTRTFLEKFGLRSLSELPPLESFAPDEETRLLIAKRLGATQTDEAWQASEDPISFSESSEQEEHTRTLHEAMQSMLGQALASSAGAVEKINFDELEFDEDD